MTEGIVDVDVDVGGGGGDLTETAVDVGGGSDAGERGDGREILVDSPLTSLDDVMRFGDLLRGFVMTGRRRGKSAAARSLLRRRQIVIVIVGSAGCG